MMTELQRKYNALLEKNIQLNMEIEKNHWDIKKIQKILRTNVCDGHCGLCHLFDNVCLIWEQKRNPYGKRPDYDPPA